MRIRNRQPDRDEHPEAAGPPAPTPAAEVRERADRLLEAADDAIRRALSDDSERFLAQNRQQGGQ